MRKYIGVAYMWHINMKKFLPCKLMASRKGWDKATNTIYNDETLIMMMTMTISRIQIFNFFR